MPRPALAASRSIDIIEFLTLFPDRVFTLSEIARATKINIASCYAILGRLTERGYLNRRPDGKAYSLGPSLIAIGQAALKSHPIVALAMEVSEELLRELDIPVLLNAAIGDEILAVLSLENGAGRHPGMWVGERLPLVAPVGAPFLAWASDDEINAWIARRTSRPNPALIDEWRRDLELTRARGYQVTMRGRDQRTIASLMSEMASNRGGADYKSEVSRLINSYEQHKSQPQTIIDDQIYEVQLIASPIFDSNGIVVFNLALGGFAQTLSGGQITRYADRLMRACLEIMSAHRARSRLRAQETPSKPIAAAPTPRNAKSPQATGGAKKRSSQQTKPSKGGKDRKGRPR